MNVMYWVAQLLKREKVSKRGHDWKESETVEQNQNVFFFTPMFIGNRYVRFEREDILPCLRRIL